MSHRSTPASLDSVGELPGIDRRFLGGAFRNVNGIVVPWLEVIVSRRSVISNRMQALSKISERKLMLCRRSQGRMPAPGYKPQHLCTDRAHRQSIGHARHLASRAGTRHQRPYHRAGWNPAQHSLAPESRCHRATMLRHKLVTYFGWQHAGGVGEINGIIENE